VTGFCPVQKWQVSHPLAVSILVWSALLPAFTACSADSRADDMHTTNEVRILSISPPETTLLQPGTRVTISARVEYRLADTGAMIALSVHDASGIPLPIGYAITNVSGNAGIVELDAEMTVPDTTGIIAAVLVVPVEAREIKAVDARHYEVRGTPSTHEYNSSGSTASSHYVELQDIDHLSERDSSAIVELVDAYCTALKNRDLDAMESLVHPDVFRDLSVDQRQCLRSVYLASHFLHSGREVYRVKIVPLDFDALQELERKSKAHWRILPEVRINVTISGTGSHRVEERLYAARKGNAWYLVVPTPSDDLVRKFMEFREKERGEKAEKAGSP